MGGFFVRVRSKGLRGDLRSGRPRVGDCAERVFWPSERMGLAPPVTWCVNDPERPAGRT